MNKKIESLVNFLESKGVDKEEIQPYLSQIEKDLKNKKYGLIWEEQEEKIYENLKKNFPILKDIKEKEIKTKNNDNLTNILIEGDNLEALTALQYTHKSSINFCYIDPPYNTGSGDFVYNDRFINKDNSWRHSSWLSFMNKRLKLAKELLADDGVIFISIDDNEAYQLKLLCDEIFEAKNFVSNLIWVNNLKGRQIDAHVANVNEYILCYAKNISNLKFNKSEVSDIEITSKYIYEDSISKYAKGVVLYNTNSKFNIETRKNLVYSIYYNPITEECICLDEKQELNGMMYLPEENLLGNDYIKIMPPIRSTNGKRGCWRWSIEKFNKEYRDEIMIIKDNKGNYMAYTKDRLSIDGTKLSKYKNLILDISSTSGTNELTNIFRGKPFDYPKPSKLIKLLLQMSTPKDAIVLDFFAGSGTTGQSVLELNKEDGGNRQFILCTNNENNICEEVTYQRLNKVINGYTTPRGKKVEGLSGNLKYYKIELEQDLEDPDDNSNKFIDKCIDLISIKENCFNKIESNAKYDILENQNKVILVYKDINALDYEIKEVSRALDKFLNKAKILYSINTDVYIDDIEIKEYPTEIIEQIKIR